MQTFYAFCLSMRGRHWFYRLMIVLLSFSVVEALVVVALKVQGNDRGVATLFIFTGILAVLLFPWKFALPLEFTLLILYLSSRILILGWNILLVSSFAAGVFTDLFIVGIVGFLWKAWEMTERARAKEQELTLLKDQFIANIYHELRTPVNAIVGVLDLLSSKRYGMDAHEYQQFLDRAVYAANELQRQTHNMLNAGRSASDISPPWMTAFDLGRIIDDVARHTDLLGRSLQISMEEGIQVRGDPQQVEQILTNLLSNGCKYSASGLPISITIERREAYVQVSVQDQGPGIPPEELPRLFQKFSRLERDVGGPTQGIGLGLYISRRLIENMGGRIWVESPCIEGTGSRFVFTLWLADE